RPCATVPAGAETPWPVPLCHALAPACCQTCGCGPVQVKPHKPLAHLSHTHTHTHTHMHACIYSGENKYLIACRFRKFGHLQRSEERRVGKECRSRWSP